MLNMFFDVYRGWFIFVNKKRKEKYIWNNVQSSDLLYKGQQVSSENKTTTKNLLS